MNWLTNFVKPKLSALVNRREVPENLWQNCPSCANMLHHKDLNENLRVCYTCNYHFRMSAEKRIDILFGDNNFKEIEFDVIEHMNSHHKESIDLYSTNILKNKTKNKTQGVPQLSGIVRTDHLPNFFDFGKGSQLSGNCLAIVWNCQDGDLPIFSIFVTDHNLT